MNQDVAKQGGTKKSNTYTDPTFFERLAFGGPALTVVINAADTSILYANNLFEEYTGYSKNSDTPIRFIDQIAPNRHDRLLMQLHEVAENPLAANNFVIYNLRKNDGSCNPFYVFAAPVAHKDNDQYLLFQLSLVPDLSKQGMPYTSLETRDCFFEHFENEGFGTFERMIDGDTIFWSPGTYSIFEVDNDIRDINYLYASTFIHPQDSDFVRECVDNAIRDGGNMGIEFRIITARNNIKILHCLAKVIKDKNGKSSKFVGSIRDITKQRAIEDSLKNKVDELHHSNRELEEFAYAASHDMQEPLRKITTFSNRLSEKYGDALAEEGNMYLSRMTAAAENMRLLINGLLEFSKISKTATAFELIDLNTIIQKVTTELELKIEETATIVNTSNLPTANVLAPQMKQLFVNLIGNAIKFHKPNISPIINIESHPISEYELKTYSLNRNKDYHKIVVTDNGIGFEKEYANRIFQVFQRLHGKSEYPGSGIGLAICKKILELHHGLIYAENIDGVGARFVMLFPKEQ